MNKNKSNFLNLYEQNTTKKGFAISCITLFLFSTIAAVSAAPVEKEPGASSYAFFDEWPVNNTAQYSYDGSGVNIGHPGWGRQVHRFRG
ncbi:MAG: hypothetical protein H8D82_01190 [Euryarchaeota archaeon]|nr:hypothetical protein [Euryarchaeota archaeon]